MTGEISIKNYLNSVTALIKQVLGTELVGLYLSGSLAYQDFKFGQSDIDLLAVSRDKLSPNLKTSLTAEAVSGALSHVNLPCPAAGLELMIVSLECASIVPDLPIFEFAFSIGEKWATEIEEGGVYEELLLDFAICRQFGISLYGPAPEEVFAPFLLIGSGTFYEK